MAFPLRSGRFAQWFSAIIVLVGVVVSLPGVFSGYMADDYFFTGGAITPDAPFGYYNFTEENVATEIQPWWTSPDFKVRFFRPLSSLTLHLDFTVMKGNPLMAHLHSLFWFVLLLVGAHRLYRDFLSDRWAKWAMALFAVSAIHVWNAEWIASRHAVTGGAITVFAAHAYFIWRERGHFKYGLLSLGLFVVGLLTSEVTLSFFGFAVSYEALFSKRPLSDRLRAISPVLFTTLLYLVFYKSMGYGTDGSDVYTDPFSQPGDFLLLLIPKTLSLIGAGILGVPASLRLIPEVGHVTIVAGVAGLVLLISGGLLSWKRFSDEEKRILRWLALMSLLSLFPPIAGVTMGREFALFGVGLLGIASLILITLLSVKGSLKTRAAPRTVAILLFAGMVVISPLSKLGMSALTIAQARLSVRMGASETGCEKGSHVLVLTGGSDMPIVYAPHFVATIQGRFFSSWHQLVLSVDPVTIERPSADRLVISSKSALVNTLLLREKDNPLVAGDTFERRLMKIEVKETTFDAPTKVAFQFKSMKDLAKVCTLKTEAEILKPIRLPEVGQSMTVPHI